MNDRFAPNPVIRKPSVQVRALLGSNSGRDLNRKNIEA
jgi:hypothetical protein